MPDVAFCIREDHCASAIAASDGQKFMLYITYSDMYPIQVVQYSASSVASELCLPSEVWT